jgi:C4-dicarboxylate-specific signal transduction histidine kinase
MTDSMTVSIDAAHGDLLYQAADIACFSVSATLELEWTPQALALLRLQPDERPRSWSDFAQRFLDERARHELQQLIATRDPGLPAVRFEVELNSPDGARGIVGHMRVAQGGGGRLVGVLHDRTAAQRREAERLEVGDRLQQLGRWSLLGEMASGLAHELNQPLAAISAFAQAGERMLSRAEPQIDKAKGIFAEVSQQSSRAGAVIERMRALIKRQTSKPQVVSYSAILTDFEDLAAPIARTHQTRLEVDIPPSDVRVRIDPSHVHQVLLSLLRNALDAMQEIPPNERQIRVYVEVVEGQAELSVADTGPGIAPEVARELFRPFFTTKPDGTGMGLAVCRSILAEHGGTVRFVNGERGARFIVSLPLAP